MLRLNRALATAALWLVATGVFAGEFEIAGGITPGGLLNGKQQDTFSSILTPTPNQFNYFGTDFNARYYFGDFWGIYLGDAAFGGLSVKSDTTTSLSVLNLNSWELGVALRYSFRDREENLKTTLNVNGGINYTFMAYNSAFTSLASNVSFYSISPALGFFIDPGFQLYITPNFFWGLSLKFATMNGYIAQSGLNFTGTYFVVPIFLGFSI